MCESVDKNRDIDITSPCLDGTNDQTLPATHHVTDYTKTDSDRRLNCGSLTWLSTRVRGAGCRSPPAARRRFPNTRNSDCRSCKDIGAWTPPHTNVRCGNNGRGIYPQFFRYSLAPHFHRSSLTARKSILRVRVTMYFGNALLIPELSFRGWIYFRIISYTHGIVFLIFLIKGY